MSKTGQGPKTSILLFEKGGSTDWTWFYKVTNDGYTMGTNSKEQPGNQLVECLTLYHEYVKHGKRPPESKHQFCIPAGWIKTLDPRIKEKIRVETRADLAAKGAIERAVKEAGFDRKIKACKLSELEKEIELKQFDQILENRIQNEIAKRIDKAHNYSFNLSNYKSALNAGQVADWKEALKTIQPNGVATLDEAYKKLKTTTVDQAARYIAKLDPTNALEADIVREYVSNLEESIVAEHSELYTLRTLLESGATYPKVKLGTLITLQKSAITVEEETLYKRVTCKLNGQGIQPRDKVYGKDVKTKRQQVLIPDQLLVAEIDAKFGGYGIVPDACEGGIVSSHYYVYDIDQTELLPAFLGVLLQSPLLLDQVKTFVKGTTSYAAIRGTDFLELDVPLPTLDQQTAIVAQVDKQKGLIEGVEKVLANWEADICINSTEDITECSIGDICSFEYGEPLKESDRVDGEFPVVGAGNIIGYHEQFNLEGPAIVLGRRGATSGFVQWIDKSCFVIDTAFFVRIRNKSEVDQKFLFFLLQKASLQKLQSGGAMPGINRNDAYRQKVKLPDLETQRIIVSELDAQMQVLEGLRTMKTNAETKINAILSEVWSVTPEPAPTPTEA